MKTKKKFLAEPFFRVVAILFVGFSGSRNSFRGNFCAQFVGECSCADFALVAILFVGTWGSRSSFRGNFCAQSCGGTRAGVSPYPAFKMLYKNPLSYLKGNLVREK